MQEQEDTTTPALRSQLAETESAIENILKAIEQGIFTPSTKQRLDELKARKEEILVNIQAAELQKPKLTREQMTTWFDQFRHGDPANREFQKHRIDTFVNAVYVFDDKLVLTYNYQHGTQTIALEEIESTLSSDFDGATPPNEKPRNQKLSTHKDNIMTAQDIVKHGIWPTPGRIPRFHIGSATSCHCCRIFLDNHDNTH